MLGVAQLKKMAFSIDNTFIDTFPLILVLLYIMKNMLIYMLRWNSS